MKNISLLLPLLMAIPVAANAQETAVIKYPVRIGIKGGVNVANFAMGNTETTSDKHSIPAWQVGAYADMPILPVLSLQAGLALNSKGAKFTVGDNSSGNYSVVTTRPLYLELPVNLVLKLALSERIKFFAGAGPYFAVGIAGKNKIEGQLLGNGYSGDERIEYSNDDPQTGSNGDYKGDLKRFDFGLNFLAGLEVSHFTINANYGYGFTNIRPGGDNGSDNNKFQNRVFSITAGILF